MKYLDPTACEHPPERSTLVYDDDCGFCLAVCRVIQRWARQSLDLVPFSEVRAAGLLHDLSDRDLYASAHLVTREGVEYHGGESITHALRLVPGGWTARILDLPGLHLIRDAGYRLVETNRRGISKLLGMDACSTRTVAASDTARNREGSSHWN